jgi:hypothetical protein
MMDDSTFLATFFYCKKTQKVQNSRQPDKFFVKRLMEEEDVSLRWSLKGTSRYCTYVHYVHVYATVIGV